MKLPILVSQEKWQDFDAAWLELQAASEPIEDLLTAIRLAGTKKRMSSRTKQACAHAQALTEEERFADAARLLGSTLVAGGNPADLASDLFVNASRAWEAEDWFSPFCELTGLKEGSQDLRGPWKAFAKLCAFQPQTLVHHPGGWGTGEILEVVPSRLEMKVRFWNGRQDVFPLHAAVEIFEPLAEEDLRSRQFRGPDELKATAKKDPLDVLKAIVSTHNGRATTASIRNALMGIGIEGSAWTAWWRKARKLAENSKWFEVTGTPQKSIVSLLLTEKDPLAALQKNLERSLDLAQMHSRVRDLMVGNQADPLLVEKALEMLTEAARNSDEPIEQRAAAWLMLRAQSGETPTELLALLSPLVEQESPADPATPPALWKLFQELPNVKDKERALDILPEILGEDWLDAVATHLPHAADGQVRHLVERLKKAKRTEEMSQHYAGLLARPLRAPTLLVTLAGIFEREELDDSFPTPAQRGQALLNLATHLYRAKSGNPQMTRVCARLTDLLTSGDSPLLATLLMDAEEGTLRGINALIGRGVESDIDHMITDICIKRDRHFYASQAGPFWESDTIWTTKAGLARRSAELKDLTENKIPANQDAIGRAASFGDLSENSEWEAAIEEQRNLTSTAMRIEEELRLAGLLEEVALPQGIVAPGSKVRYRDVAQGKEEEIVILGPWDGEQWNDTQVVSYRAPLAAGLLGLKVGAVEHISLPGGDLEIEVVGLDNPNLE